MHRSHRQFVAAFLLLVQLVLSVTPARAVLCFGTGPCGPAAPEAVNVPREPHQGCCGRCASEEGPLPVPMPADERCPPGCDCCVDIAVPETVARVDAQSAIAELQQTLASALVCVGVVEWPEPADPIPARACWSPPPDRPLQSAAVGLRSTCLVI